MLNTEIMSHEQLTRDSLYEDENIISCVKPAGVLSTDEPGGLPGLLRERAGSADAEFYTVHRLDRVAGGAILLAKNRETAAALGKTIEEGRLDKYYLAVIHGIPADSRGSFSDLLFRDKATQMTRVVTAPGKSVQEARLEYEVLESIGMLTLVRIKLLTGRTHQIRVQFSSRGLPLVGDKKYCRFEDPCQTALWSEMLELSHPVTGERLKIHALPPQKWPWTLFDIETRSYPAAPLKDYPLPCPVKDKCGGCQLQRMSYCEQIKWKQTKVRNLLGKFGKVSPIAAMEEPFRYRNKIQAAFGMDAKGHQLSGIYQSSSHKIISVENCMLEDAASDAILNVIREMLPKFKIKYYDERRGTGFLRHVLIRRSFTTGETMVVLVSAVPEFKQQKPFVNELVRRCPEITTIVLNINGSFTSMVLGENEKVLFGKGYIEDILCGNRFRISSRSFYQVNPVQTEILYNTAIAFAGLTGKEKVLDAYCGTGTIGICAAAHAQHVLGVELNGEAVKNAVVNARLNGLENCSFLTGDAGDVMRSLSLEGERFDTVFMDPPRAGSDSRFLSSLIATAPKKVVYVSCNPETLTRDLDTLVSGGYRVKRIQPVDMFPHTEHVETVCLLSKLSNTKHHVEVELNLDEMDLTTAESKATYDEVRDYVMAQTGLHVTNLNIAQIKRKCGIIERENYNLPKSEDSRQPKCTKEKEEAIKKAFIHFGMI